MAPVYTARHVSNADKATPLFALKGLSNLAPCPISQCAVDGIALERQIAYNEYRTNLSHFIYASSINKVVPITNSPLGFLRSNLTLPLVLPPVHFTLQKEIPHEATEKMLRMLGAGASKSKIGATTIYMAPALPSDILPKILPLVSTHFNAGRDSINPMGKKAFDFISSAFAEILRVHSYAAFHDESEDSMVELQQLLGGEATVGKFTKKHLPEDRIPYSRSLSEEVNAEFEQQDESMDEDLAEDEVAEEDLRTAQGYFVTGGKDTVIVARPPRNHVINIGSSSAVPDSSGILFPYFTGLVQPDSLSLTTFVLRHLFALLGKTTQECQTVYAELRRGFNSLATTDVGMELSHIGFGIDLALKSQGRCFVIIESNRYMGFVLLGARLAVFDSTHWIGAYEPSTLREDLAAIDPHRAAVINLVRMFSGMTSDTGYSGPAVTEDSFSEPKDLVDILGGVQLDKLGDSEKEINRNLRSLNYIGDGYLHRNPQTIAEALETLFSESTIELSRPTYIPSLRSNISSREFIVLSRFGPEAPSLWNERGQEIECKAKENPVLVGSKRKLGEMDDYANLPIRILVTPKPLDIAVKDMGKVIEKGSIRIDLKERAGKNRNMAVESELMRKRIWKVLVDGLKDANVKRRKVTLEKKDAAAPGNFDDALNALFE